MKYIENKLGRQLILILVIIFDIVLVTVGFILPNLLTPIFESTVYNALKSPLDMIGSNLEGSSISNDIAYLYVVDGKIYTSNNYGNIVKLDTPKLLEKIDAECGSFEENDISYHGIIDLMLVYDNHIDIIDYKLKNLSDENYKKQLSGYKNYIENKLNREFNREEQLDVVVSDLTYVNVQVKWNYICLIIDLFNKFLNSNFLNKI